MYKPKLPPEGINSSEEHPLKEFMLLVVASGLFIFALLIIFIALGKLASHWVSIDQELGWTHELGILKEKVLTQKKKDLKDDFIDSLVADIWDQYKDQYETTRDLKVSTIPSKQPNAFMAPGGYLSVTDQLIKGAKTQNEISFVICHELGHFIHRHPLNRLGQRFLSGVTLSLIGMNDFAMNIVGPTVGIFTLHFDRGEERQADLFALECLMNKYGHVQGYDYFFKRIKEESKLDIGDNQYLDFLSSHPATDERIEVLKQWALKNNWNLEGELTPNPIYKKDNLP